MAILKARATRLCVNHTGRASNAENRQIPSSAPKESGTVYAETSHKQGILAKTRHDGGSSESEIPVHLPSKPLQEAVEARGENLRSNHPAWF